MNPNWRAEAEALAAMQKDLFLANRARLFDALAALTFTRVEVEFNGSGDEGQIERIVFYRGDDEVAPPVETVAFRRKPGFALPEETEDLSLADGADELVYGLLYEHHGGWQDNEESYGTFEFDVAERVITLSIAVRFVESVHHEYTF